MMESKPAYVRVLLLLLGIVVLPAVVVFALLQAKKASSQGTVIVRTEPTGATVSIDGEPQEGKSQEKFVLPAGQYKFLVQLDGYDPMEKEVAVQPGRVITREFHLRKPRYETIPITTYPPGATLTIDGKVQRKKTPADYVFKVGRHHLRITRPGYQPVADKDFVVEEDDTGSRSPVFVLTEVIPPRKHRRFQGERDASRTLVEALYPITGKIAALKDKGVDALAVANFTGPGKLPFGGGAFLTEILERLLENRGLTIKPSAKVRLRGTYSLVKDPKLQLAAVQIKGTVVGSNGKILYKFEQKLFGEPVIAALLGPTAQLPLVANEKKRSQELLQNTARPSVSVEGDRIAASASSPYAIEILAAPKPNTPYETLTPEVKEGLAYVAIDKDTVFAVKLINNTDSPAAATLTVDGMNMFTFSDPEKNLPPCTLVMVDAKSSVTVQGWFRNLFSFIRFTPSKNKGDKLPLPRGVKVGTITATFAAAWPKGMKAPPEEPNFEVWPEKTTRACRFSRFPPPESHFGLIRAMVSVRYER